MTEHKYIDRIRPDSGELDYASLKKSGIRLLQDLCGKTWTDYNLHDPGITILEQLCYALSDLKYRTEFSVAEYLTNKEGNIDFERQALYRPHNILPSQPITTNDYRKVIIDSISEINNVWVETVSDKGVHPRGLYRVCVDLKEKTETDDHDTGRDSVIEKVKETYTSNRNLCEDLKEVRIVGHRHYALHADLEIDSKRDPVHVLAELYFVCSKYIAPGIMFYSFEEMLSKGKSLEEIFTGPLTRHGYIDEDKLGQRVDPVTIADMIGTVRDIEGVVYIERLWFEDEEGKKVESITYDPDLQFVPHLHFPTCDDEVKVKLSKNRRKYRISLQDVRAEFERLNFEYNNLRHARQDIESLYTLPHGEFRNLREYYSIQNHFPEIYGINSYGVPDSFPTERKAQAKQLKAYLLFFEQIMANFLANLQEISRLFSLDRQLNQSYFHQLLLNKNVPNVEDLYQGELSQVDSEIAKILGKYDNFDERRNRILDYLLAIYGEKFTQKSLRHFNYYYTDHELDQQLILNKINFLEHIVEINQKRSGAFNYRKASWNTDNISILKMKICILLDLKSFQTCSTTDIFVEKELKLVTDDQYKPGMKDIVDLKFVDPGDRKDSINPKFYKISPEKPMRKNKRKLLDKVLFLKKKILSESILRNGIYLDKYRVVPGVSKSGKEKFQLFLKADNNVRWLYLTSYSNINEAVSAANDLRNFLIDLNVRSEGLHIVEHILLRPESKLRHEESQSPEDFDFYTFRISVVFPSWTARFHNKEFRKLAEETVRLNCPAHIYQEFYWLDSKKMYEFEILYKKWTDKKSNCISSCKKLSVAAEQLTAFLINNRDTELEMMIL